MGWDWERGKRAGRDYLQRRAHWERQKLLFIVLLSVVLGFGMWLGLETGLIE